MTHDIFSTKNIRGIRNKWSFLKQRKTGSINLTAGRTGRKIDDPRGQIFYPPLFSSTMTFNFLLILSMGRWNSLSPSVVTTKTRKESRALI